GLASGSCTTRGRCLDDSVAALLQHAAENCPVGAGSFHGDQHPAEISLGAARDPLSCASQSCRAGREGILIDETAMRSLDDRVGVGCGVGVDSDDVSVDVPYGGRQTVHDDVPLDSLGLDVVAGVGPGCESLRGGPVTSHAAEIELPAVDMPLIKPSQWARAGAGTRPPPDRSRE